jgi:hypothetical protein
LKYFFKELPLIVTRLCFQLFPNFRALFLSKGSAKIEFVFE